MLRSWTSPSGSGYASWWRRAGSVGYRTLVLGPGRRAETLGDAQLGQHGLGRVGARIALAALAAGPGQRLLVGVAGQHAEPAGDARAQLHVLDAASRLRAHPVVVVGPPPDDRPEADDPVVAPGGRALLGGQRQLEGPGHVEDVDLGIPHRAPGPGLQAPGQLVVEAADAERDPHASSSSWSICSSRARPWWCRTWPSLSFFVRR